MSSEKMDIENFLKRKAEFDWEKPTWKDRNTDIGRIGYGAGMKLPKIEDPFTIPKTDKDSKPRSEIFNPMSNEERDPFDDIVAEEVEVPVNDNPNKTNYYRDNLNMAQSQYQNALSGMGEAPTKSEMAKYMAAKSRLSRMLRKPVHETTRNLTLHGGYKTQEKHAAAMQRARDMAENMRKAAPARRILNNVRSTDFYAPSVGEAEESYRKRLDKLTQADRNRLYVDANGHPLKLKTDFVPYKGGKASRFYVSNGVLRGGPVEKITESQDYALVPLSASSRNLTKALATYYSPLQVPPTRVVMYMRGHYKAPKPGSN